MKLNEFSIPYPILGIDGAFNDSSNIDYDMSFQCAEDKFEFRIEYKIQDDTIINLIEEGKAKYSCEIDCSKTFYRKIFNTKEKDCVISIPCTSLVGKVHFFLSVVLVDSLEKYKNPNFNQRYYDGYSFNLIPGHILAYFGEQDFNASIKYQELKTIGSIVDVQKTDNESYTFYDFSRDKITIYLPTDEYKSFVSSNNHTYSDITHASIVQCALTSALFSFKENENTLWAESLKIRQSVDPELQKFDFKNLDGKSISEIVSILLQNPNKRMFKNIQNIQL
ncbi:MAG: hypothetical protein K5860_02430 [Bacteroidales bacterium]|nr:hypothetical protein [Bacteroidales bacterium]